jgi:hypothetical protein
VDAKEAPNQTLRNRLRHNYEIKIMDMMNTKEKNKGQNKLRTYCKFKKDHKQDNYLTTISTSDPLRQKNETFGTSSYD